MDYTKDLGCFNTAQIPEKFLTGISRHEIHCTNFINPDNQTK